MVAHCLRFRDFTVDDAAISYAYSQSFAHGNGLVGFAGGERVEGYSNFLWVILVGACTAVFGHILIVGKVLGLLLAVLITLGSAELLAALRRRRSALDALPAALCAAFTPVPYWSMSGLENPLYLALTLWCCVRLVQEFYDSTRSPLSALLAAGAALTRPDGLLLAVAALAAQLLTRHQRRRIHQWTLCASLPIAAHLGWRYFYYAYPWPNTFYVKVAFPFKLHELFDRHSNGWKYVLGFADRYHLATLVLFAPLTLLNREVRPRLVIFAIIATVVFFPIYARGDWMSEGRFAVDAVPLLFVLAIDGIVNVALLGRRLPYGQRTGVAVGIALFVVLSAVIVPHSLALSAARAHHYPIPVEVVATRARRYQQLAKQLDVEHPSVADGDAGGNLLYGGMPLIDIGWLTDGTLSHWGRNPGFVREYIYRERRPTFLRLTGYWLGIHLQSYSEFDEYVATPDEGLYVARSAFTTEGVDTRSRIAALTDSVDLVGYDVTPTDVRAWLLAKADHPATQLFLRTAKAEAAVNPSDGFYSTEKWRDGEVVKVKATRPDGQNLNLCASETCIALADGRFGAQPVALPVPSAAVTARLMARGELEAARAALASAHQPTQKVAAALYRRGLREEQNGETDSAFDDYEQALKADPSLSFARRHFEALRTAPRAGYHPWIAARAASAAREFYLKPSPASMDTLAQLARQAGQPERAVRAQLATSIIPASNAGLIDLAECYLALGLPEQAAALLPSGTVTEVDLARIERIARAADRRDALSKVHVEGRQSAHPIGNGITLTSIAGRLSANGAVLLDMVLSRNAVAPAETILINGYPHLLRRNPKDWADGERVLETVAVDAVDGHSSVSIGSIAVNLDVSPFVADFERGRIDGWTAEGTAFETQPVDQRWHEAFGTQGDKYLYSSESGKGRLTSPLLSSDAAEVCFFVRGDGVLLQSGEKVTEVARGQSDVAQAKCLVQPHDASGSWRIVAIDGSEQSRVIADDFTCFAADGRSTPCGGHVIATIAEAR